jgi:hypothetical protein
LGRGSSVDGHPDGTLARHVFAHWRVGLEGKRVLLLDGTADRGTIEKLVGQPVVDITPAGHLAAVHDMVQRPVDVTKGMAAGRVQAVVIAMLEELTQARVGLIGHKRHVEALMSDDGPDRLPAAYRERIVMATWFGGGPDRASNEWHRECDVLLIVGTLRPNAGSIRRQLVVQGDLEAAGLTDGTWASTTWDATTITGEAVVLQARGYIDPAWRLAHQAVVRAGLRQAVGRARAGLPEGIPAVVLTTEPLGIAVDLRPVVVRRRGAQDVLDAMRAAEVAARPAIDAGAAEVAVEGPGGSRTLVPTSKRKSYIGIGSLIASCAYLLALRRSVLVWLSGQAAGRVADSLAELARAGSIHQPCDGYWAIGPQPDGDADYVLLADGDFGRPPEAEARTSAITAVVAAVADSTAGGAAAYAEIVTGQDAAARTAKRALADAVAAGRVVKLDRGLYATELPVTAVDADGARARCWVLGTALSKNATADDIVQIEVVALPGTLAPPPAKSKNRDP